MCVIKLVNWWVNLCDREMLIECLRFRCHSHFPLFRCCSWEWPGELQSRPDEELSVINTIYGRCLLGQIRCVFIGRNNTPRDKTIAWLHWITRRTQHSICLFIARTEIELMPFINPIESVDIKVDKMESGQLNFARKGNFSIEFDCERNGLFKLAKSHDEFTSSTTKKKWRQSIWMS